MIYSPIITEALPPVRQSYGDKWSARPAGARINGLIVHHHATTGDGGVSRLVNSADKASANYIIRTNGSLIGSVPEEYRAWTSGSYAADDDKITVEVQNSTGAPEWRISDAAFATLVRLYADVAKRHGFPPDRAHISGHRDYAATSCPGPWLYPRLGDVAAQASGTVPVSNPVPAPAPAPAPAQHADIRAFQRAIRTPDDNVWGPNTQRSWDALLAASRFGGGRFPWGVQFTQQVVGTPADGVWGKNSRRAHDNTVIAVQSAVGAARDGIIGPETVGKVAALHAASNHTV